MEEATLGTGNGKVIQVRDLVKQFGSVTALDHISLDIPQGAIFGFIGPSGCGKTTTVRCMIGNYRPTEGVVKVFGRTPDSFYLSDKKRIGYMPQLFILYPELSVWDNLNFAASIYGYPLKRKARLQELLDLVELSGHEKKLVRDISGGMQRRLSLATTLIHDPELIFLDEPTAGIDPVLRRKFWDYFRRLRDEGHTLFVTTQYVGEAAYCDYVGVMAHGALLMVETPEDLRYKAMGGDIVQFHASSALNSKMITDLRKLPYVSGELAFLDSQSVQLIVEDASTAIPRLLDWGEDEGIEIEAINQHVPPFDDVFVKIMEDEKAGQKRVEISE
jgi:ABC-2 type transport system ATP-binding protein